MTLTETLTRHPELVDELLTTLNLYVMAAGFFYGLPLSRTKDKDALRSLVLAWIARLIDCG